MTEHSFKRWWIVTVVVALLLCAGAYAVSAQATERAQSGTLTAGDLNGDGRADAADVRLLRQHLVHTRTLTGSALKAADVNGDGAVDVRDAMALSRTVQTGTTTGTTGTASTTKSTTKSTSSTTQGGIITGTGTGFTPGV